MKDKITKAQYDMEYAKKKLKRIPLDVTKEKYQEIKTAAERANESVNGYIKKAIDNRMSNENQREDIFGYVANDTTATPKENDESFLPPWEEDEP